MLARSSPAVFSASPQLASAAPPRFLHEFNPRAWSAEVKHDGHRRVICDRGAWTRTQAPAQHPHLSRQLPGGWMLDGELVASGASGHDAVSAALLSQPETLRFVAFDVLMADGVDVRASPQVKRREILEGLFARQPFDRIELVEQMRFFSAAASRDWFEYVTGEGGEGLVFKRDAAPYSGRRCGAWLKAKAESTHDVVIVGAEIDRSGAQRAGYGFFCTRSHKLRRVGRVDIPGEIVPGRVVEVSSVSAQLESGAIPQPKFIRFRADKPARQCTFAFPRRPSALAGAAPAEVLAKNPILRAQKWSAALEAEDITHAGLARRLGVSRSKVSNALRLLSLPRAAQEMVARGELSEGHGRALAGLPWADEIDQRIAEKDRHVAHSSSPARKAHERWAAEVSKIAHIVRGSRLTVRETERLVRRQKKTWQKTPGGMLAVRRLAKQARAALGSAEIAIDDRGRATLTVEFDSIGALEKKIEELKKNG